MLFSEMTCRICHFAAGTKILLFDKNGHFLTLIKKELFLSKHKSIYAVIYFDDLVTSFLLFIFLLLYLALYI